MALEHSWDIPEVQAVKLPPEPQLAASLQPGPVSDSDCMCYNSDGRLSYNSIVDSVITDPTKNAKHLQWLCNIHGTYLR